MKGRIHKWRGVIKHTGGAKEGGDHCNSKVVEYKRGSRDLCTGGRWHFSDRNLECLSIVTDLPQTFFRLAPVPDAGVSGKTLRCTVGPVHCVGHDALLEARDSRSGSPPRVQLGCVL